MKNRNWFRVYMRPEGAEGSAGGGGTAAPAASATAAPAGTTAAPAAAAATTTAAPAGTVAADALLKEPGGGTQTTNDDPSKKGEGADDGKKQGEGDDGKTGDKPVVPEKYELQLPEGMTLDEPAFAEFSAVAKEIGLTQEQAQKVAAVQIAREQKSAEETAKVIADWDKASQSDAEFGGDKFTANLAVAKRGLDAFATPELKGMLGKYGLVNNPEILRYFYRVGNAIGDDKVLRQNSASTGEKSLAKTLYPHLK